MSDRVFFSAMGLAAVAMIVMALVWPQGQGARSPGPFGRPVEKEQAGGPKRNAPSILPGLSAATGDVEPATISSSAKSGNGPENPPAAP